MIAKKETQIGDPQKVCRRSMPHARRVLGASLELELLSGSGQDSASLLRVLVPTPAIVYSTDPRGL